MADGEGEVFWRPAPAWPSVDCYRNGEVSNAAQISRAMGLERSQPSPQEGRLSRESVLLNNPGGFILVEPAGKPLADGPMLSPEDADYELSPRLVPRFPGPLGPSAVPTRARS